MKLAYSSNAFTRDSLLTAIRATADLGYEGVEILCDRPHWFPGEVSASQVRDVRAALEATGLEVSNLNANTANGYFSPPPLENTFEPALSNVDGTLRRWRQDYTIQALELAHRIGAGCVSVTSGHPVPGVEPAHGLECFVESLKRVCRRAEALGVRVGVEYEPGLLVERASELSEVLQRVDSAALGANLDIGHSWLDGEDPGETVARLSRRIWNVHVEDIRGRKHFHLPPGEGDLPFPAYFDALRDDGYDGFLTVELYTYPHKPVEVGRQSIQYLRRLGLGNGPAAESPAGE